MRGFSIQTEIPYQETGGCGGEDDYQKLMGFHLDRLVQRIPNQPLKQTGRANATIERFFFAGVFRGSIVFQSAPSGSLALRYELRKERRIRWAPKVFFIPMSLW